MIGEALAAGRRQPLARIMQTEVDAVRGEAANGRVRHIRSGAVNKLFAVVGFDRLLLDEFLRLPLDVVPGSALQ